MDSQNKTLLEKAYAAFNSRNIPEALTTMHSDIQWPKAFEGGYVDGHDAVREYWTRQWKEIDPEVQPVEYLERGDGTIEVTVNQKVKDLAGNIIFDGIVKHVYTVKDSLLRRMDVEE